MLTIFYLTSLRSSVSGIRSGYQSLRLDVDALIELKKAGKSVM